MMNYDETVEKKIQSKYSDRRKQLLSNITEKKTRPVSHTPAGTLPKTMQSPRSPKTSRKMRGYNRALQELIKAVINPPDRLGDDDPGLSDSDEDLTVWDDTPRPPQDSQVHYTETDVTLPSCLNGSLGSRDTEATEGVAWRERGRGQRPSNSSHSSPSVLGGVYREMMIIYEQLKAEREGQQQWERRLEERERRLEEKERRLEERNQALDSLSGLEEVVHTRTLEVQQTHQKEVREVQELLREREKENRRLRTNFQTIKELNDSMKTQLNEVSEQNKRLESQTKRMQARLENLQRKYEHSMALRGRETVCVESTEPSRPSKQETTAASGKPSYKGSSGPASLKLLALLLDWVLDGQTLYPVAGDRGKTVDRCLPPEVFLHERSTKALPLLTDQLHQTPSSEPLLLLSLLRLIYWAMRHIDNSTQPVALSSTLRRLGEEVSRPSAGTRPIVPQAQDSEPLPKPRGPHRTSPLYRSPCPQTRILSTLIILRTVTQADLLAQALDGLLSALACEESGGLFLRYGGVCVLLSLLRTGRGGLHTPIDILMQLTGQSRLLASFLEACSCEDFFLTVSSLLKNPRLELPTLENISILLQKLSTVRKNRRLFERCSLHLQLQELHRTADPTHTFLCLNITSTLLNLK